MFASRLWFFVNYYFKKHITKKVTAADIFQKKLFRFRKKVPGSIVQSANGEMIYAINDVNGRAFQLIMRSEASSDIQVMHQIYATKEYLPLVKEIKKRNQVHNIRFIIDAGANVGYTSVYLKAYFPEASITAIEPDKGNAQQAQKNFLLNKLPGIRILEGAIWFKEVSLELKNDLRDGKEWSYYVVESATSTNLKGLTFESVLAQSGNDTIDILKIDIEGAEKELFQHAEMMDNVLNKTRFLTIEIHDDINVRPLIYQCLSRNGFAWFNHQETTIATNLRLLT